MSRKLSKAGTILRQHRSYRLNVNTLKRMTFIADKLKLTYTDLIERLVNTYYDEMINGNIFKQKIEDNERD